MNITSNLAVSSIQPATLQPPAPQPVAPEPLTQASGNAQVIATDSNAGNTARISGDAQSAITSLNAVILPRFQPVIPSLNSR